MEEEIKKPELVEKIKREAPPLASVLREMKEGLDVVRSKVEALTAKESKRILYRWTSSCKEPCRDTNVSRKDSSHRQKLQYQIQKLTTAGGVSVAERALSEEGKEAQQSEDVSNYKPKPDLLADKMAQEDESRAPKFAPMSMDDKTSKQERDAARKEKHF
ncbi:hypothetical protein Bca52824_092408 [Brassica carinata]|uniref:Uncharacterized protein n=1 Tax=Brassica carinata TaxID=52824 RepID=A0A8X7NTK2_BRACI|nr:hypothetical protein Bca52824_092408 [Brassica carinata]